jgi:tripartite-type tricarboxylate transporter receptor subunit TctC
MIPRRPLLAALSAAPLTAPAILRAQGTWPSQPVRLVVPFAAGGPTDVPAWLIADELSKILPQRVIVENRTGAGVIVGSDFVAKAPKDGGTLLYTTIAHSALRATFNRLPFDPIGDFQPVVLAGVIPMLMMVNKDLPVNSLQDLTNLLGQNSGKYDYGSSGNGAALHLAMELYLRQAGGLRANHVPYRGSAQAMPDLLNGTLAMMLDVANSALPFVQRGEVKGLAVSASRRLLQVPNVPTFQEGGAAGYEAYTWHMIFAPTGTPAPVVTAVNAAVNRVMAMESVKQRLSDLTMETRSDTTPGTARAFFEGELGKWEPVIRAAGIRAD